jgi:hypothetical protein
MDQRPAFHSVHPSRQKLERDTSPSIHQTAMRMAQLVRALVMDPQVGQPPQALAMAKQPHVFAAAKVQAPRLRYERSRMFISGTPSKALEQAVSLGFAARDFPELDVIANSDSERWQALLRGVDGASQVAGGQAAWPEQGRVTLVLGRIAYHVAAHEAKRVSRALAIVDGRVCHRSMVLRRRRKC